ncbi:MAG TPA: cell division protein FtsA [Caldilineaceae bacterium]|nr:cell division protein FtsA [Caldilineaceae bacterium]
MQEVISAIDIGTTKICALTAEVTHDSLGNPALRVVGEGQAASRGIRRGVVVNVQEAANAIAEAVELCERDMGQQVVSAYVGIAGSHIGTLNSKGVSPIDRREGVTQNDMQRALEGARAVALPQNQEVIHAIARHWTVDGQNEVQQPLGMNAYRLEVDAHIVTGSSTAVNNLLQCVMAHGIEVDELVLEPLASDRSVLRNEERHMGVAVVDMGGGTTDIAIFVDNGLCHTQILDLGGNHLSNDIAVGLHAPYETAEELKIRYGTVLPERVADDEQVWASVFGEKSERSFSRRFICEILEARAVEMFEIIHKRLEATNYLDRLPAGVVLTGGASQLPGMAELGREILQMPVRIGAPAAHLPVTGLSRKMMAPSYATSIGLLLWGLQEDERLWRRHYALDQNGQREWLDTTVRWLKNLLPD